MLIRTHEKLRGEVVDLLPISHRVTELSVMSSNRLDREQAEQHLDPKVA
jgi:hypothetical protein